MFSSDFEMRLQHWAAWIISFLENKQGWPIESAIAKFLREGFSENNSKTSSIPFHNPSAEDVNKWFNILKREFPENADAVYLYYISRRKVKELARSYKITPRTFYKRVEAGKRWLEERISL